MDRETKFLSSFSGSRKTKTKRRRRRRRRRRNNWRRKSWRRESIRGWRRSRINNSRPSQASVGLIVLFIVRNDRCLRVFICANAARGGSKHPNTRPSDMTDTNTDTRAKSEGVTWQSSRFDLARLRVNSRPAPTACPNCNYRGGWRVIIG